MYLLIFQIGRLISNEPRKEDGLTLAQLKFQTGLEIIIISGAYCIFIIKNMVVGLVILPLC